MWQRVYGSICVFAACPLKEGMSSPTIITDDDITSTPESDTVKNVRPSKEGKYVEDAAKEPTVTVKLVDENEEPVPIGEVKMTGNVPSFTVLYQTPEGELTPVTVPGTTEPQVKKALSSTPNYC
jgi:hypothetical protein